MKKKTTDELIGSDASRQQAYSLLQMADAIEQASKQNNNCSANNSTKEVKTNNTSCFMRRLEEEQKSILGLVRNSLSDLATITSNDSSEIPFDERSSKSFFSTSASNPIESRDDIQESLSIRDLGEKDERLEPSIPTDVQPATTRDGIAQQNRSLDPYLYTELKSPHGYDTHQNQAADSLNAALPPLDAASEYFTENECPKNKMMAAENQQSLINSMDSSDSDDTIGKLRHFAESTFDAAEQGSVQMTDMNSSHTWESESKPSALDDKAQHPVTTTSRIDSSHHPSRAYTEDQHRKLELVVPGKGSACQPMIAGVVAKRSPTLDALSPTSQSTYQSSSASNVDESEQPDTMIKMGKANPNQKIESKSRNLHERLQATQSVSSQDEIIGQPVRASKKPFKKKTAIEQHKKFDGNLSMDCNLHSSNVSASLPGTRSLDSPELPKNESEDQPDIASQSRNTKLETNFAPKDTIHSTQGIKDKDKMLQECYSAIISLKEISETKYQMLESKYLELKTSFSHLETYSQRSEDDNTKKEKAAGKQQFLEMKQFELTDIIAQLEEKNRRLVEDNKTQAARNQELQKSYTQLKNENEMLQDEIHDIEDRYLELQDCNEQIKSRNHQLEIEAQLSEKLQSKCEDIENKCSKLQESFTQLENQNASIKDEKDKLYSKNEEIEMKCRYLEETNSQLKTRNSKLEDTAESLKAMQTSLEASLQAARKEIKDLTSLNLSNQLAHSDKISLTNYVMKLNHLEVESELEVLSCISSDSSGDNACILISKQGANGEQAAKNGDIISSDVGEPKKFCRDPSGVHEHKVFGMSELQEEWTRSEKKRIEIQLGKGSTTAQEQQDNRNRERGSEPSDETEHDTTATLNANSAKDCSKEEANPHNSPISESRKVTLVSTAEERLQNQRPSIPGNPTPWGNQSPRTLPPLSPRPSPSPRPPLSPSINSPRRSWKQSWYNQSDLLEEASSSESTTSSISSSSDGSAKSDEKIRQVPTSSPRRANREQSPSSILDDLFREAEGDDPQAAARRGLALADSDDPASPEQPSEHQSWSNEEEEEEEEADNEHQVGKPASPMTLMGSLCPSTEPLVISEEGNQTPSDAMVVYGTSKLGQMPLLPSLRDQKEGRDPPTGDPSSNDDAAAERRAIEEEETNSIVTRTSTFTGDLLNTGTPRKSKQKEKETSNLQLETKKMTTTKKRSPCDCFMPLEFDNPQQQNREEIPVREDELPVAPKTTTNAGLHCATGCGVEALHDTFFPRTCTSALARRSWHFSRKPSRLPISDYASIVTTVTTAPTATSAAAGNEGDALRLRPKRTSSFDSEISDNAIAITTKIMTKREKSRRKKQEKMRQHEEDYVHSTSSSGSSQSEDTERLRPDKKIAFPF